MKLVSGGMKARLETGTLAMFSGKRANKDSSSCPRLFEQLLFQRALLALKSAPITVRAMSDGSRLRIGSSSASRYGREGRRYIDKKEMTHHQAPARLRKYDLNIL
jgi:hypothetical protein